ncbi:MAG TPA: hypothetical protein VFF27_00245 [Bacteroidia bacterium]|jgi:hypothetical protein|nr:hypothetical protein [Bacteroidia bacterium]
MSREEKIIRIEEIENLIQSSPEGEMVNQYKIELERLKSQIE